MDPTTTLHRIGPDDEKVLGAFFLRLADDPSTVTHFRPHPLTVEEAARIAHLTGRDRYYLLRNEGELAAYGMLRGWDEGFTVPALGIAVDPAYRRRGIGRVMMRRLCEAAEAEGANNVMLTVDTDNSTAIDLFQRCGFVFNYNDGRLKGFKILI